MPTDFIVQHDHWQKLGYRNFVADHWQRKGKVITYGYLPKWDEAQNNIAAEINQGRWIVNCRVVGCGGAFVVTVTEPFFICIECANQDNDGKPYNVTFPKDFARIERALLKRPAKHSFYATERNWKPGEKASVLEAENNARGIA